MSSEDTESHQGVVERSNTWHYTSHTSILDFVHFNSTDTTDTGNFKMEG